MHPTTREKLEFLLRVWHKCISDGPDERPFHRGVDFGYELCIRSVWEQFSDDLDPALAPPDEERSA